MVNCFQCCNIQLANKFPFYYIHRTDFSLLHTVTDDDKEKGRNEEIKNKNQLKSSGRNYSAK